MPARNAGSRIPPRPDTGEAAAELPRKGNCVLRLEWQAWLSRRNRQPCGGTRAGYGTRRRTLILSLIGARSYVARRHPLRRMFRERVSLPSESKIGSEPRGSALRTDRNRHSYEPCRVVRDR